MDVRTTSKNVMLTTNEEEEEEEQPKCHCNNNNNGMEQLQQQQASTSRSTPTDLPFCSPPPLRIVPDGQETALLTHHYQICDLIEKGPICTVYRALHRSTGRSHTVKSLDLKRFCAVSGLSQEDAEKEVEICASLKHPYFVQLNDVISGNNALHMVFEWVEGEDICFEIVRRAAAGFIYSEAVASHYTRQLVEAIRYLHSLNIVHRDIRPHNLLLANKENNAPLKVRGLALAHRLCTDTAKCAAGRIGVPQFMAPEVVGGKEYGKAADMWSVGVILYVLLCGQMPFVGKPDDVFQQISGGHYSMSGPLWASISEGAKDLLRQLLCVEPTKRTTPEKCLRHEWFKKTVPARLHLSETIENIRRYNARRRLKSNIVSSVNNARLNTTTTIISSNNNNNNLVVPKVVPSSSSSSAYFGAQSLSGGDSCDFECLPQINYSNTAAANVGQRNRTEICGVERVLTSLDQMCVLTDCVAGVQHQQQLLDQALNDSELHQLLLPSYLELAQNWAAQPITSFITLLTIATILADQATASDGEPVLTASSFCSQQRTPFFRLSAPLSTNIRLDEQNDAIIARMMWDCMEYMHNNHQQVKRLCALLKQVSHAANRHGLFQPGTRTQQQQQKRKAKDAKKDLSMIKNPNYKK